MQGGRKQAAIVKEDMMECEETEVEKSKDNVVTYRTPGSETAWKNQPYDMW